MSPWPSVTNSKAQFSTFLFHLLSSMVCTVTFSFQNGSSCVEEETVNIVILGTDTAVHPLGWALLPVPVRLSGAGTRLASGNEQPGTRNPASGAAASSEDGLGGRQRARVRPLSAGCRAGGKPRWGSRGTYPAYLFPLWTRARR